MVTSGSAVSGQFGTVTDDFALLDATLSADATNVYVTLTRSTVDFAMLATTPNQTAAATAIQAQGPGGGPYDAVVGLTASEAGTAFDQLSGEFPPR